VLHAHTMPTPAFSSRRAGPLLQAALRLSQLCGGLHCALPRPAGSRGHRVERVQRRWVAGWVGRVGGLVRGVARAGCKWCRRQLARGCRWCKRGCRAAKGVALQWLICKPCHGSLAGPVSARSAHLPCPACSPHLPSRGLRAAPVHQPCLPVFPHGPALPASERPPGAEVRERVVDGLKRVNCEPPGG
jgi:hypothetical protein